MLNSEAPVQATQKQSVYQTITGKNLLTSHRLGNCSIRHSELCCKPVILTVLCLFIEHTIPVSHDLPLCSGILQKKSSNSVLYWKHVECNFTTNSYIKYAGHDRTWNNMERGFKQSTLFELMTRDLSQQKPQ